jgi:hypothetical protein
MRYGIKELKEMMELLDETKPRQKHNVGNQPNNQNMHGIGGLLSRPGARPEMWSALSRARTLTRYLPFYRSEYEDQIHELFTGQLDMVGSNGADFCAEAPTPGKLKVCQVSIPYGKLAISTDKITMQTVGLFKNRADTPRTLLNSGEADNRFVPEVLGQFPLDTRDVGAVANYRAGVAFERLIGEIEIVGDPSKSPSATKIGAIREFRGLDGFIKTGYTDVDGVTCPALDSAVINFNANVGATASDTRDIVEVVTDMYVGLNDIARQVGIDMMGAFVMHPYLFYALTDTWACSYVTSRCEFTSGNNNRLVVNGTDINSLRIDMLNGQYLLVNGIQVPVILADGIPDGANGNNSYTQDLYFVPLIANGRDTLYYEYVDMDNEYVRSLQAMTRADEYFVLNEGLYGVSRSFSNGCLSWQYSAMTRMVLDTPFLAGRVDNITFTYLVPSRSPYPGRSLYVDGGVSIVS